MTKRSTVHESFTLERSFAASPARVWKAFSDKTQKAKWFSGPPDWPVLEDSMDFRVGGRDVNVGGPKGGPISKYHATYMDIVENERIITTYEMYLDDRRISVSVACFELRPEGKGTRLVMTDHGVYLDGLDGAAQRKEGSSYMLDLLGASLDDGPSPSVPASLADLGGGARR